MRDINEAAVTIRVQTGMYTDVSYEWGIQFSRAMNTISSVLSPDFHSKYLASKFKSWYIVAFGALTLSRVKIITVHMLCKKKVLHVAVNVVSKQHTLCDQGNKPINMLLTTKC